MSINKKIILVIFFIMMLFNTQFGYAINKKEPIGFCLKSVISLTEDNSKHEVTLKITNRNSSGAAKIQEVYFAPSSSHEVTVDSTDVSQCSLLKSGASCQASAVILADKDYVNAPMPVEVSYVIDREDSNTNTGSGLGCLNAFLNKEIEVYVGIDVNVNSLKFSDASHPELTLKNVSKSPISIKNVYLESGRATSHKISNGYLSARNPEESCVVTMKLSWNDKPSNNHNLNSEDYIVVNYDDAEGNAKEFFLPVYIVVVNGDVTIKFPSSKLSYYQFNADLKKYIDAEASYSSEHADFLQHIKNWNFADARKLGGKIQNNANYKTSKLNLDLPDIDINNREEMIRQINALERLIKNIKELKDAKKIRDDMVEKGMCYGCGARYRNLIDQGSREWKEVKEDQKTLELCSWIGGCYGYIYLLEQAKI